MEGELPEREVTFVATDVEGSTRLWGLDAGAMQMALARHDAILSDTFGRENGRIFKHTGDGVYAAFLEPDTAARAAIDAQRQLCRERWPAPAILNVRFAVVTGKAHREGTDYRGPALNRCARYLAVGHGGQILLSSSTAEGLRGLPEDTELVDLGEHLLRDLSEPERIFRLAHPDLPPGPVSLRSLAGVRHNLPEERSSFVGRVDELIEIEKLIETHRLVSLVGAPGCGKTRLVLQLGRIHLERYPDGVWFVPLAHQTDPTLLVQSVGRKLGVVERPDRYYLDSIIERMRSGRMLLILDNCEHLLDPCAALATRLLDECHELNVLATSREPLVASGEQIWRVPGLDLPEDPTADEQTDAVRLFIERALEADPHFNPSAHPVEICEVCVRLDGLPLAIELAAARLRSLTIADLVRHLADRFDLLVGGARSAPPHQQTLNATIDWSYQLLTPDEQRGLMRLAVFVKGFDLAAAAAVLQADPGIATIDLVGRLVDKSLVVADRSGAATRYSMLETIRSFGVAKLEACGEGPAIRRLHALHFLAVAESGHEHLHGSEQLVWLARLEQERSNLRAAWTWSLEHQSDWAYRFACSLAWFWSVRGRWQEGRNRFEQVLVEPESNRLLAARARLCRIELEVDSGWPADDTPAMISEVRESCRDLDDNLGLGRLQLAEAKLAAHRDLVETVIELASSAAETLQREGERWHAAEALIVLGEAQYFSAGVDAAEVCFSGALEEFRALGDRWGASGALKYHGEMVGLRGNPGQAVGLIEESLLLARQIGDQGSLTGSVASSEVFLGRTLCRLGRYAGARASLVRAIEIYRASGNQLGLGWAMAILGQVDLESGDFASAGQLISQAYDLMHSIGFEQGVAWTELNLAHLLLHENDLRQARELAIRSLTSDEYRGDRRAVADSRALLGRIELAAGRLDRAETHLQGSLEAFTLLGIAALVPGALEGLASLAAARHDIDRAAEYLARADHMRGESGMPVPVCDLTANRATREVIAGFGLP